MPTRKQRRRREKLKRHEWEEVYVDEEGRELDPDEAEQLLEPSAGGGGRTVKTRKTDERGRDARTNRRALEPPSMRRTLRRGLLFFPLMLVVVFLLAGDELTTAQKVTQAAVLLAFFLPFSYFMDAFLWRTHQRRLAKQADAAKKR